MRSLGVAMTVTVAGLIWGVVPASAAPGTTDYENVGNPGWCLDGNGTSAYLRRCGPNQTWQFSHGSVRFTLRQTANPAYCLTAYPILGALVYMSPCADPAWSHWDAWGMNGWIVLKRNGTGLCAVPQNTHVPGRATYELALTTCPEDVSNVPNRFAWRYVQR
jgi:hypothetical protein